MAAVILAIPTAPAEAQQTSGPALTNVLATPATVTLGEHTMLSWDYRDDVVYVIIRGPDQAANVYTRFSNKWSTTPAQTGDITYTLEAYNAGVKLDAVTVTVTVTSAPSGPVLSNVVANPATVMEGGSSTLSWTPRADVEAVLIRTVGGLTEETATGTSHVVTPSETTTYEVVAMGEGAELAAVTVTVTVTVTSAPSGPVLSNVVANPATVMEGGSSTLSWTPRADVEAVLIRTVGGLTEETATGTSHVVTPSETTTYEVVAMGEGAELAAVTVTVTVTSAPSGPVLSNVVANPATVMEGGSSTLSWTPRADVEAVLIRTVGGLTEETATGTSHVVTPSETTTYEVVAMGEGAELAAVTVTVTVTSAPSGPVLSNVVANPATVMEGGSSTLSWTPRADVEAVLIRTVGGLTEETATGTSHVVTPSETTTYEVVAMGEGAELAAVTVTVTSAPSGPVLSNVVANPATIKLGESSDLQWTPREDVVNVRVLLGEQVLEARVDPLEGRYVVTPDALGTVTYTLVPENEEGAPLPTYEVTVTVNPTWVDEAVLSNVVANPATIKLGESSDLQWTPREDVVNVRVLLGEQVLEARVDPLEGRYVVTPDALGTVTYTLVPENEEGAPLPTYEVTVTVNPTWVDEAVLSNVVANPATIKLGESSDLQWTPREDVVNVRVLLGEQVLEARVDPLEGRYVVTPDALGTVTYTLVPENEEGAPLPTYEVTVTVNPTWVDEAVLSNVVANPATIKLGESSDLQWTPREDVVNVRVLLGEQVLEARVDPLEGRYVVTPDALGTVTYTLVPENEEGAPLPTYEVTVTVNPTWVDEAVLSNVVANPATIKLGESSDLQWTPREDVVNVRVLLGEQVLEARVDPLEGRYVVTPDALGTVTYTLVPENEEGAPLPTYEVTVTVNPTWVDEAVLSNVVANPATIKLGESSDLQWTPREDVVNVRVLLGEQVLEARVDPLEGRYVVTPDALGTVTYTLVPENEEGAPLPTYEVTVTVNPTWVDEAVLSNVVANPATIKLGESSDLQWTPREDVVNVRVLLGEQVLEARVDPLEGRYVVTPDALGTVTYTLVPENEEGAPLPTYEVTVTVNPTWVDEAVLSNVVANPATIKLGESSDLQWTPREDVVNVRVLLGEQVLEARVDPLEGRYVVTPDALGTVTYTLVPENEEGAPLPTYEVTVTVNPTWVDEAVLSNVVANPATIKLGESSDLQWTPREDVVNVRVLLGEQVLEARVDPLEGRYVVTPDALGTVTYTLVPENEEGAPLPTYEVTVTVNPTWVDEAVLSNVVANPATIKLGESSDLQWTPREDVVNVRVLLGEQVLEARVDPLEGRYVVTPDALGTVTYTLVPENEEGAPLPTYEVTVTVNPTWVDEAVLSNVVANPATIKLGESSDLQWTPREDVAAVYISGGGLDEVRVSGNSHVVTPPETGTVTYTLSAQDDEGAPLGDFSVTVHVAKAPEPNISPVAGDDRGPGVDFGRSVTIQTATLLENDQDDDGDELTITAVSGAQHGTVSLSDGTITFTHDGRSPASEGYAFTYTVSDGNGGTDTATVSGQVIVPNKPPAAKDDSAEVIQGESIVIQAATLLANDSDPDGDTLTLTRVSDPRQGTVSLSGRTITFAHDGSAPNPDQPAGFRYTVSDGQGGEATGAVNITVLSRPHVVQVAVTSSPGADATYAAGDVIEVAVTFSEPVTVAGVPRFALTVGSTKRAMRFVRATGAKLLFAYTVVWNDRDDDGVSVAANVLAGGAIRSAAGVDAGLSHDALPNQPGHKVLGLAAPTVGDLLPAVTLVAGGAAQVVDLAPAFIGAAAYAATSSDTDVATVSVADAALTVTPGAREGTATVTVTASNRAGSVDQTFTVRVMLDPAEVAVIDATLAAFGRNVLASATDTIGRRFESTSRSSTLTVAGRRIPLAESDAEEAAGGRIGIDAAAEQFALAGGWVGWPGVWSPSVGDVTASEAAMLARSGTGGARDLTAMDLLGRSEFALSLGGAAGQEAAGGAADRRLWTVWGAGDLRSFNGGPEGASYTGRPTLAYVGLDTERGRLLAGVAVSRATADMSYSFQNLRSGTGEMSAGLTSVQPYLRYAVDARTDVWGLFGAGSGSLDLTRSHAEGKETSDLGLLLGAAGVRRELGSVGAADLALRGDVGMVRLSTDGASGVMLADRLANVQRYRVGVEVSTTQAVGGGQMTPFVELGGLYDGGSGQTGAGMEVAGGLQFLHAGSGFGLEARARMLALHAASGYSERGVLLTASLTPGGRDGRGLSLSVAPGYGAPAQGGGMMWRDQVFGGAPAGLLSNHSATLDSRVGYGLQLGRSASTLLTPYSEYGFAEAQRRLRFGVRLGAPDNFPHGLQFDFAGEQSDYNGRRDYRLGALGRIRF